MLCCLIIGVAGYLDRVILGSTHMYNSPTCKDIYETKLPYDPEGKKTMNKIDVFLF
jgi:hypothetical protein